MTIRATATPAAPVGGTAALARTPGIAELPVATGVILGGTLQGDVVIVSYEALALLRAGLAVRAFIVRGIEKVVRTISIGGGRVVGLAFGVYAVRRL
jgi:hypothetical protein